MVTKLKTNRNMLDWQYSQLLGELQELQRHASDPTCPCNYADIGEWCISKHALSISYLASETAAMDETNSDLLWELSEAAKELHEQTRKAICGKSDAPDLVTWSRGWRKRIEPLYYSCKVMLAAPVCSLGEIKEPWQMTREEWNREFEKGRPSSSGSHNITSAANIGKSVKGPEKSFECLKKHLEWLKMNLPDKIVEGLQIPARHFDVVKHALNTGKPVPPEVLKDYPDLVSPACSLAQVPKVKITGTCEESSGQSIMFQEGCRMEQLDVDKFARAQCSEFYKTGKLPKEHDWLKASSLCKLVAENGNTELHLDPLLAAIGCQIGIGCLAEAQPLGEPTKCKLVKDFVHCRYQDKSKFDSRSFRTKEIAEGVKVTVGCPKGEWSPSSSRCKSGTEVQRVLYRKDVCSEHEGCRVK